MPGSTRTPFARHRPAQARSGAAARAFRLPRVHRGRAGRRRLDLEAPGGGVARVEWRLAGPRSSYASWSDGSVRRYASLAQAFPAEAVKRHLWSLWDRTPRRRLTRRAIVMCGGVHGGIYDVPPDLALSALAVAVPAFLEAFERMETMMAMEARATIPLLDLGWPR